MEHRDAPVDPVELLDQHRRLTSRLARRYGRFEAEDLASEALVRTLRRPAPDGSRQPWIERILRNLVVDRARRSGRAAAHAVALSGANEETAAPNPEEQLLLEERCRAVQEALPTIPSRLRDAVMGRFYEGHDYGAVAATRGISPATARTRVHRALASLRASLGRLRVVVPMPQLLGAHSFSATTALLPAVLSAALVVPSLAGVQAPLIAAQVGGVLVAQASPRAQSGPLSIEPPATPQAAAAPLSQASAKSPSGATARRPFARQGGQAEAVQPAAEQPAAVTKYDFENDQIEGDLARPDGVDVHGDPAVQHSSLIEIRREFVAEIAKMLEEF